MSDRYQDDDGVWHYRIFDREDGDFLLAMGSYGVDMVSIDRLIEGESNVNLTDKQRAALMNERSEALRAWDAGDFNLARALATALHRLCENRYMCEAAVPIAKDLKKHKAGLTDEGRHKGGQTNKERSEAHKEHLKKPVEDILRNPQTFDWRNVSTANRVHSPSCAK